MLLVRRLTPNHARDLNIAALSASLRRRTAPTYKVRDELGAALVSRPTERYSSRSDDATIRVRLRELASVRRRFGYRRLLHMIRSEGVLMNHKRLRRLYAEERLQFCRRGLSKRVLGTRAPMALPQGPNQRWSQDFVGDTLTDSRRASVL